MDKINMMDYQQYVLKTKFGKKQEKTLASFSPSSFQIRKARFKLAAAVILCLAFLIGVSLYG